MQKTVNKHSVLPEKGSSFALKLAEGSDVQLSCVDFEAACATSCDISFVGVGCRWTAEGEGADVSVDSGVLGSMRRAAGEAAFGGGGATSDAVAADVDDAWKKGGTVTGWDEVGQSQGEEPQEWKLKRINVTFSAPSTRQKFSYRCSCGRMRNYQSEYS